MLRNSGGLAPPFSAIFCQNATAVSGFVAEQFVYSDAAKLGDEILAHPLIPMTGNFMGYLVTKT